MIPQTEALVALRGERTQEQFAEEIGVSRVRYNGWENGEQISLANLRRLVSMGLDAAYLLGDASSAQDAPESAA